VKERDEKHRKLRTAFNAVVSARTHAAIDDRVSLRDAVCAYLAAEQARGSTVESVVQTVKEILRKAEDGAADTHDELAEHLVDSCLGFNLAPGLRSI
jgi:hemerythrin